MKQLIFLFLVCLMAIGVSAAPQLPYIIYGNVDLNGVDFVGAHISIEHNGVSATIVTNEMGNYVKQLTTYSDGDSVTIRVLDNCGIGDVCQKSLAVGAVGFEDFGILNFAVTGSASVAPSCPACPSCSSSSSSGSSCYIPTPTEEKCTELYPPAECPSKVVYVPTMEDCKQVCEDEVCPAIPVVEPCETCTNDQEKNDAIAWILTSIFVIIGGIVGMVLGKYSWFAGFKGLSEYRIKEGIKAIANGDYAKAKTQLGAAFQMFKTSIEKAENEGYDK